MDIYGIWKVPGGAELLGGWSIVVGIGLPIKTFLDNIRKNIYIHAGTNNKKLFETKEGEVYGSFEGWREKKKWCNHIIILKKKYSFKK